MFEVSVEETFAAGHALRGYRGKCENVHGHNYRVQLTLEGPELDGIGLLVDFVEVKKLMTKVAKKFCPGIAVRTLTRDELDRHGVSDEQAPRRGTPTSRRRT